VVVNTVMAERWSCGGKVVPIPAGARVFSFICDTARKFRISGAMPSLSIFVRGRHKDIVKPSGARDI
jgi:hypothetical protein